jgi:hypothetical protein
MDTDAALAIGTIVFLVCLLLFIILWQIHRIFKNNRNNNEGNYDEV